MINLVNGKLSDFVTFKQMIIFGAATFAFKFWYLDFKGSSKSFRFNFLLWEHLYLSSFTPFLPTYVFRSVTPAPRPRLHMHVFFTLICRDSSHSELIQELCISDSAPVLDVPKPVSLDKDSVVAKQRKRTDNKLATKLENNEGDRKASLNISPEPKPPVDPVKPQSPLKKPKEERLSPTKALVRASSERRSPFKSPSKAASDYSMCDTLSPRAGRKRKQTKEDDIDQEQADISSKKSYQPTSASTGKAQTSILSFFKVILFTRAVEDKILPCPGVKRALGITNFIGPFASVIPSVRPIK